jgi:casein kinase 1 epsilon
MNVNKDFLINGKYSLREQIGSGSFGTIYRGENIRTKDLVAIKIEPIKNDTKMIKNESIIYTYLKGLKGIPDVKWFGKDMRNYYMVINLLGQSLEDIKKNNHHFSLRETLDIGIQCLKLLMSIHGKGVIHRDIKPENFLLGLNKNASQIYIIDFGLAKTYIQNDKHIQLKNTRGLIGSFTFASINAHRFIELSRRDDLESLGYMLIYLFLNVLDWQDIHSSDKQTMNNIVRKIKENIVNNKNIPTVLTRYISIIRNMEFEEKPDYDLLIHLFTEEK